MIEKKMGFKTGKSMPINHVSDYGKYGQYKKNEDGKWERLKKGYPAFRKTLDYRLMKSFLVSEGECESFLEKHGVKTLRSIIESKKLNNEYEKWLEENNAKGI